MREGIRKLTREQLENFTLSIAHYLYGEEQDADGEPLKESRFNQDKEFDGDTIEYVQMAFDHLGIAPEKLQ